MAYGLEIREKVVKYVKNGHSAENASEVFDISARTIYYWLKREELAPTLNYPKYEKINKEELKKFIKNTPDAYLREIAEEFNVSISAVHQAFSKLNIVNKKNSDLQRSKRRITREISENIQDNSRI